MSIGWLKIVLLSTFGLGLAANDYTAEIANGGLRARKETRVAMRSERLFISQSKIRVEYEFVNESTEPVETVVAFPWPGYHFSYSVCTYMPSMWDFLVEVDGQRVPHQAEARATVNGRDITSELVAMGIHIPSFGYFDQPLERGKSRHQPQLEKLAKAQKAELTAIGALVDDEMPCWQANVTHHWIQRFPPGKTIKVVHEYVPMIGGSSYGDLSMITTPKMEITTRPDSFVERDFDARDSGCPDVAFKLAYEARRKAAEKQPDRGSMGLGFNWVRYILTTANTWKGPIRDFELIVERNPGDLITFCWDGPVEKIGPDRFRARWKDFRPEKELTVYFVPSLK